MTCVVVDDVYSYFDDGVYHTYEEFYQRAVQELIPYGIPTGDPLEQENSVGDYVALTGTETRFGGMYRLKYSVINGDTAKTGYLYFVFYGINE